MANIVTRTGKGSQLTWAENDANFTNLNNDKIEVSLRGAANGIAELGPDQKLKASQMPSTGITVEMLNPFLLMGA